MKSELRKRSAYDRYRSWVLTARETPDLRASNPLINALGSMLPVVADINTLLSEPVPSYRNAAPKNPLPEITAIANEIAKHPITLLFGMPKLSNRIRSTPPPR